MTDESEFHICDRLLSRIAAVKGFPRHDLDDVWIEVRDLADRTHYKPSSLMRLIWEDCREGMAIHEAWERVKQTALN